MGISVADNFDHKSKKPLDARTSYTTLALMKAVTDANMNEGCLAYCAETDKYYKFLSTNTVDSTTGKWREFSSGGGGTSDYPDLTNKPSINNVTLNGNKSASDLSLAKAEEAYSRANTTKSTLSNDDYIPFNDRTQQVPGENKNITFTNFKSVLKNYFDTLYDLNKNDIPMYGTSSTGASTTAKTASVTRGTFTLVAGAKVSIKFTNTNTASEPTLNVGSTGAKNIKYIASDGIVVTPSVWWGAGDIVTFIYDGTQWLMQLTYAMPSIPMIGTIDRSTIYDTTEKVIGKFTDGRPVYQKVLTGTMTATSAQGTEAATNVAMGVNVSSYVDISVVFINASGATVPIPCTNLQVSQPYLRYVAHDNTASTKNTIVIYNAWTLTALPYRIIVQYTKTTDLANSYNYANENDYSTSEKIVGTWISGKPIYQKTFTATMPTCSTEGTDVANTIVWSTIGISAPSKIISIEGFIDNEAGTYRPLNCVNSPTRRTSAVGISTGISFTNSVTGMSGKNAYVTIKYTKT